MTPKQRIMAGLNLEEPDKVPFVDWTDPGMRQKLVRTLGYESSDDAQFHAQMGMDAICYAEDDYIAPQFCKKLLSWIFASIKSNTATGCACGATSI